MVAETPGGIHEGTSRRLPQLAERIALVRGAPIVALGAVGLVERYAAGAPVRAMQADETLYLHPDRAVLPEGSLIIGEHDLPDVVLEVDYTTDILPGKLRVYERWGFPELWAAAPPGARRRPAGMTIYRLAAGRYRPAPASTALPGWTAPKIHAALSERAPSAQTDRVLERTSGPAARCPGRHPTRRHAAHPRPQRARLRRAPQRRAPRRRAQRAPRPRHPTGPPAAARTCPLRQRVLRHRDRHGRRLRRRSRLWRRIGVSRR